MKAKAGLCPIRGRIAQGPAYLGKTDIATHSGTDGHMSGISYLMCINVYIVGHVRYMPICNESRSSTVILGICSLHPIFSPKSPGKHKMSELGEIGMQSPRSSATPAWIFRYLKMSMSKTVQNFSFWLKKGLLQHSENFRHKREKRSALRSTGLSV